MPCRSLTMPTAASIIALTWASRLAQAFIMNLRSLSTSSRMSRSHIPLARRYADVPAAALLEGWKGHAVPTASRPTFWRYAALTRPCRRGEGYHRPKPKFDLGRNRRRQVELPWNHPDW